MGECNWSYWVTIFHRRFVSKLGFGVFVSSPSLVEHIGSEGHSGRVEAKLGVVRNIGGAQRHVEPIDVDIPTYWFQVSDPIDGEEVAMCANANCILKLQNRNPKAPSIWVIKGARVTQEGTIGIAAEWGWVWNTQKILRIDRARN